ncbi:MAG: tetratricopeptide repeat protein [Candidatus Cryptobacteroides sp.]
MGTHFLLYITYTVYMATAAAALNVPSSDGNGDKADSLIRAFDSRKGAEAVQTARQFFDILEQEEFTDGEIIIPPTQLCRADSIKALTWYWAGEWYFDRQDYGKAMEYSLKAMPLCAKAGNPLLEADCANILSILYFRKSDWPTALEYAKRTLEIGRGQNDIGRISYALNTIAGICLASRQAEEGEKYILEAIRLCEQEKDSLKLAVRCGMAAEIYHSMAQEEKSLEYSRRAYEINSAMGLQDKAAIRLSQMAAAYIALGEFSLAQDCLEKAIPVLKDAGNLQSWAISCNLMGEILLEQGDTEAAANFFRDAVEVFSQRHDFYNESRARLGLSKALMRSDPAESARQMLVYGQLRDSIYDSEMNKGLNEMHARWQNDELQADRDRYRRRLFVLSGAVLFVIVILAAASALVIRRRRSAAGKPQDKGEDDKEQAVSRQNIPDKVFMESLESHIRQAMSSGKVDFEEIASKMCISRTHLNRKVKSINGGTTTDLVLSIRISTAKELLLTTGLPVWEIAHRCGIDDPTYFSTLFKKAVGKTPVQFRNDR